MVCHEDGCKKRAYYGRVYGEKPEFCPEHGKKRRFINVKNKRCIKNRCNIRASYGVRGKGAEYCAKHGKEIGLTNIVSRLCLKKGCTKHPRFGPLNGKKRTHCKEHKGEGVKRGLTMDVCMVKNLNFVPNMEKRGGL